MKPHENQPIELPWWVLPLGSVPAVILLATLWFAAPIGVRLVAAIDCILLLTCILLIAIKIESKNIQSVYISTAYGLWVFPILIWLVEVTQAKN
jgi:hypothetical protein